MVMVFVIKTSKCIKDRMSHKHRTTHVIIMFTEALDPDYVLLVFKNSHEPACVLPPAPIVLRIPLLRDE